MKLTISIPDDLYECYEQMAERLNGRASPPDVILAQLERFKHAHAADRIIVVDAAARQRIETILGGNAIHSGEDLAAKIQALADIEIGQIRVDWSPAQLRKLKAFSIRHGKSVETIAREIVRDMSYQFFGAI